jgi:hypothetical protein
MTFAPNIDPSKQKVVTVFGQSIGVYIQQLVVYIDGGNL